MQSSKSDARPKNALRTLESLDAKFIYSFFKRQVDF